MLSKSNLHDAMNNVKPSIKFRVSDNMSTLMQTLVEGMRGREVATGSAPPGGAGEKRPAEGGEGGGGGRRGGSRNRRPSGQRVEAREGARGTTTKGKKQRRTARRT